MQKAKKRRLINVHEAKTNLSRLLEQVQTGEEFLIARHGRPVAVLAPLESKKSRKRVLGGMRGRAELPEGFDAPLTGADLEAWY